MLLIIHPNVSEIEYDDYYHLIVLAEFKLLLIKCRTRKPSPSLFSGTKVPSVQSTMFYDYF